MAGAAFPGLPRLMAGAYRAPRAAMARLLAEGPSDGRLLAFLFLACGMGFLASLPTAVRAARALDIDQPLAGAVSAHLFGYLFIAPLLVYGAAALAHLLARPFGARGGFFGARAAVIWSLLLAGPIALLLALGRMGADLALGAAPLAWQVAGLAAMGYWLWLFAAGFAEAEGFAGTGRVALAFALLLAGLSASLGLLLRAAPVTG